MPGHFMPCLEYRDPEDQPYAILSHTWGEKEVTFDDADDGILGAKAEYKQGFDKIRGSYAIAREKGIDYTWVDTCCIDKRSSAELTESINSMFKWYQGAAVCIVYLHDLEPAKKGNELPMHEFRRCKWFSRGWTLQELIAPKNVEFYDNAWVSRGTKADLAPQISEITKIDVEVLRNSDLIYRIPVGRRMSWAADRATTRVEDRAYSLFGIFDVNMPLIYGEGEKAFGRLQEAIARENNDLSLFAWQAQQPSKQEFRGIFAHDPSEFRQCNKLDFVEDPAIPILPFSVTNMGLEFTHGLGYGKSQKHYFLNLNCTDRTYDLVDQEPNVVVIRLVKAATGFVRTHVNMRSFLGHSAISVKDQIYIPKTISTTESTAIGSRFQNSMRLRIETPVSGDQATIVSWQPSHLWDAQTGVFLTGTHPNFTALIEIELSIKRSGETAQTRLMVAFGLKSSHNYPTASLSNRNKAMSDKYGVFTWRGLVRADAPDEFLALAKDALKDPYALSEMGHRIRRSISPLAPSPLISWSSTGQMSLRDLGSYTLQMNFGGYERKEGDDGFELLEFPLKVR